MQPPGGLGAVVHAGDIRPEAAEQAKSLGARIIDLGIPEELALSPDKKFAKPLPEEWLEKERAALKEEYVAKADIVIASALVPGRVAPVLITEKMVKSMQPGSCIVDISIDQERNCELTVSGERVIRHGVVIEGIKNIPGMIPNASTWMFSNNVYNLLKYLSKDGKIVLDLNDEIVASILVTKDGKIVHAGTLEAMGQRGDGMTEIQYILLAVFFVAMIVGYLIINKVPSLLHTPLMSGMNALSGVTVLWSLVATALAIESPTGFLGYIFGFLQSSWR